MRLLPGGWELDYGRVIMYMWANSAALLLFGKLWFCHFKTVNENLHDFKGDVFGLLINAAIGIFRLSLGLETVPHKLNII